MADEQFTNPAGRLHRLLTQFNNLREMSQAKAWAAVFGMKETDPYALVRALKECTELHAEAVDAVKGLPGVNHDLYLRWAGPTKEIFNAWHLQSAKGGPGTIADTTLLSLEYAANELAKHHQERALSQDQLQSLLTAVDDLIERIAASTIDELLARSLLRALSSVRESLNLYRIRGIVVVEDAFEDLAGSIARHATAMREQQEKEELRGVLALLFQLGSAINFALDTRDLIEGSAFFQRLLQ